MDLCVFSFLIGMHLCWYHSFMHNKINVNRKNNGTCIPTDEKKYMCTV